MIDIKKLWYAVDGGDIETIRSELYDDQPEYQPRPIETRDEQLYGNMEGSDEESGMDVIRESQRQDAKYG